MSTVKILLTTTSYQDTPGRHHDILASSSFEVVQARGPLKESVLLDLIKENGGFDGFLCGDDEYTEEVIRAACKAPRPLRVVAKYGIGIDKINVKSCTAQGIPVLFTPGVNHTTVAEHTMMLAIAIAKHLWVHALSTKNNAWTRKTGIELFGQTMGIIGLGRIGQQVALRAKAFGMQVVAFGGNQEFAAENGIEMLGTVEDVLCKSNFLSLHCGLNEDNRGLINKDRIALLPKDAVIINTARGGLVVAEDVAEACRSGRLYGYGCDVLDQEPMIAPHPFDGIDNIIITPHVGSRTTVRVFVLGGLVM